MSNRATVLFFATLREKAGVRETTLEFQPGTHISDIKKLVVNRFPGISQNMQTAIVAMNHEFAFDENLVPDGAEIAFFPPVSGGSTDAVKYPTIIKLVDCEIQIMQILEEITLSTTGAACIFSGIVRGETNRGVAHTTESLEYEAYHKMAEMKMIQISGEIRSRWANVEGIAIVQRIGILPPGTVSVIIACASSHRDNGIFEAARYGIDRLKEIVPIWKKERSMEGEEWLEGDYFPQEGE